MTQLRSALFWFLYQISQFGGNLYVFFAWKGKDYIDSTLRILLSQIFYIKQICKKFQKIDETF